MPELFAPEAAETGAEDGGAERLAEAPAAYTPAAPALFRPLSVNSCPRRLLPRNPERITGTRP